MTTANDLQNALSESLEGPDETATQTVESPTPEVKTTEDIVAQAAADAIKSASPSDDEVSTKEKGTGDKGPIPYDRFSKVIAEKNDAIARLDSFQQQHDAGIEREDTLRTRVGELESEHQILEAIRAMKDDTRYAPHVETIDKALQGIHEEVEVAVQSGDNTALQAAEAKFAAKAEELEELVHKGRADSLYQQADSFAADLLDSLPEQYTDVDKNRLGEMWTPRVDWAGIEETGAEAIPDALRSSFADLVRTYGQPQGALEQRVRTDVTQEIPEEARPSTPEATVQAALDKDWAGVDEGGKPNISDDQFSQDLAKVLRATRGA